MSLGLNHTALDFEILETNNSKTLVFVDSSDYMEEPDRPLLEVILPGFTKFFLVNVTARTVNTFNSSTLGLNQVFNQSLLTDLPDGIWTFKFKICPYKYVFIVKRVMRVTMLLKKLRNLYNQLDLSECEGKEDRLRERMLAHVHILIEGAKAEADVNQKKAQRYYHLADKLITNMLDKFCKHCKTCR